MMQLLKARFKRRDGVEVMKAVSLWDGQFCMEENQRKCTKAQIPKQHTR
jgi:hypothetical protein